MGPRSFSFKDLQPRPVGSYGLEATVIQSAHFVFLCHITYAKDYFINSKQTVDDTLSIPRSGFVSSLVGAPVIETGSLSAQPQDFFFIVVFPGLEKVLVIDIGAAGLPDSVGATKLWIILPIVELPAIGFEKLVTVLLAKGLQDVPYLVGKFLIGDVVIVQAHHFQFV